MMNRLFLIVFSFLFLSLNAAELELFPIGPEKIKERALYLENGRAIYFFTDHTFVYVRTPPYEDQTWSEWWDSIEHTQPDTKFYFQLDTWDNSPSTWQIYGYQWKESPTIHPLENLFESTPQLASSYLYFIENKETGEMTLCQIWSPIDLCSFTIQYGKECYSEGYKDGFIIGYSIGYSMGGD